MSVLITNRVFVNTISGENTSFLKINGATTSSYIFNVEFKFEFIADTNNFVQILAANQLRLLNNRTWNSYGFLIGNSIDIDGVINPVGGGSPIVISETVTIIDLQNDILIHDGSLSNIGEIFTGINNTEFSVTNNTITEPEVIDIYFNLVPNGQQGDEFSLIDGEVNRARVNVVGMATNDTRNANQLGNKSGGEVLQSVDVTKTATGYIVIIDVVNFLIYDGNFFTRPSQFLASDSVKPFCKIEAYAEENNPNSILSFTDNFQNGNVGWFNENFNQGLNDFTHSIEIKDSNGDVIQELDHTAVNTIEITVNSVFDFEEFYIVNISHLPNVDSDWKNNQFTLYQNFFTSILFENSNTTVGDMIFGKLGASWSISNISKTITTGQLFVRFDLTPNADLTSYFDARPSNRNYFISIEPKSLNRDNAVSLLLKTGAMQKAPIQGGEADEIETIRFYPHDSDLSGAGFSEITNSRIHDDLLIKTLMLFDKAFVYENMKLLVQVKRTSDDARFNLQETFINLAQFPSFNGLQFINYFENLNTTLPSPGRNFISLQQTADLRTNYNVELEQTLFIDWRFWVQNNQAFAEFLSNRNQKFSNYYDLPDYEIIYRIEFVRDGVTFFKEENISAFDYDEPTAITDITLERLNGDPIGVFPPNEVIKVIATHTLPSGNFDDPYGFIQFQKFGQPTWAIISTEWNHTTNNAPLSNIAPDTTATLDVSGGVARVECLLDTAQLQGKYNITARISDDGLDNVFTKEFKKVEFPEEFEIEKGTSTRCKQPFLVLADLNDGVEWKNDFRSIAFIADSLDAVLVKNGVEMPALGQPITFPFQPDAVGFIVNWREVLNTYGAGCYNLIGKYDIGGFEYVANYGAYELKNYSIEICEQTVRLYSQYDDKVKMKGINFKDSGFINTIRFRGFFGNYQPNTTTLNLLKKSELYSKVRNVGNEEYEFITAPLNSCHTELIQEMLICGNDIKVSDFNTDNHKYYRSQPVVLSDEASIEYEGNNTPVRSIKATLVNKNWLIESKYSENASQPKPFYQIYDFGTLGTCPDANYTITDQRSINYGSGSIPSGATENINIIVPRELNISYKEDDDKIEFTVLSGSDGVYTTIDTTGLTNVVIEVNSTVVTAPITLAVNDEVEISFDPATADGVIIFEE